VDPIDQLLRQQAGVITRRHALRHLSAKAIEHQLVTGRWRRLHRGVFSARTGPLSAHQRLWLAVLAAGGDQCEDVVLGGLSALHQWGLKAVAANAIDVLVPAFSRFRVPPGIRVHRTTVAPDGIRQPSPPATLPGRSVVDAAAWARSDEEAVLIVAASFQQEIVRLVDVQRAADEQPRARRRKLVLNTAADCSGGSHSTGELDLLALCRRYRLPEPSRQVQRRDGRGRTRYLDAVFEPWRVAVEIDGAHHLNVAQMWDDAVKSNALELDGFVVLRYPAFALRRHAAMIAGEIGAALRKAGWSPDLG
jgi:very-short-patch-repair endonuclease